MNRVARPASPDEPETGRDGFSEDLEAWLQESEHLLLGNLVDVLDERGFALVLMLLLLFPSALPIPTGGVTHVFELVAVLVVAQMIVGRRELWLPRRVADHQLGDTFRGKAIPAVITRVRWLERFARPRLDRVLSTRAASSVLVAALLLFVTGAFVAPPFTGLDTLPSLGVVVVCLGLVFSDAVVVGAGLVVGTGGIAREIALGSLIWSFFGL
jgi:hypothetical protein